jgi:exonuclease V
MQQGSKIHRQLEDQVHTTIRIDVTTKEDGFALKIWNVIQGLRTLRDTGMTRELEVWGMIDGNLVNGIIDKLSYQSPNPAFEEELSSQESVAAGLPTDQSTITDFYQPKSLGKAPFSGPKVYLSDVKTRGSLKSPNAPALIRPAKVQLFLYHRLLSDMASDKLEFSRIFRRYGLDQDEPFSDHVLAQLGELHDEIFDDAFSAPDEVISAPAVSPSSSLPTSSFEDEPSDSPPAIDLIRYRTLRELLTLLAAELQLTFPHKEHNLGPLLSVEYRYRGDGHIIDTQVFPMDNEALDLYLAGDMQWWRGDRRAKGVPLEEAFKCRTCEFAEGCSWRKSLDEEKLRSVKARIDTKRNTN